MGWWSSLVVLTMSVCGSWRTAGAQCVALEADQYSDQERIAKTLVCPPRFAESPRYHFYVLIDASTSMLASTNGISLWQKATSAIAEVARNTAATYPNVSIEVMFFLGVDAGKQSSFVNSPNHVFDAHAEDWFDLPSTTSPQSPPYVTKDHAPYLQADNSSSRKYIVIPVDNSKVTAVSQDFEKKLAAARPKYKNDRGVMTPLYEAMRHVRTLANKRMAQSPKEKIKLLLLTDGWQDFTDGTTSEVQSEFARWLKGGLGVSVLFLDATKSTTRIQAELRKSFGDSNVCSIDLQAKEWTDLLALLRGQLPKMVPQYVDWPSDAVVKLVGAEECVATKIGEHELVTTRRCLAQELHGVGGVRASLERISGKLAYAASRSVLDVALKLPAAVHEPSSPGTLGVPTGSSLALETEDQATLSCAENPARWRACEAQLLRFLSRRHRRPSSGAPIVQLVCADDVPTWRVLAIVTGPGSVERPVMEETR